MSACGIKYVHERIKLLSRQTTDLTLYDEKLQQRCDTYEIELIENYKGFLLASGELPVLLY